MTDLLLTAEVSQELRVPQATLRFWRHQGSGPRCFKMGRRVFYRREDVDAWLREQYDKASRPNPAA